MIDPGELFAARLKRIRERRGMRMQDLAEAAGVSISLISYFQAGKKCPSPRTADALSRALGVPLATMLAAPERATCLDVPPAGFTCNQCGATS